MLRRFEREAKALARLSHSNILKVHDFGDIDGLPYLVMEYLAGCSLKNSTGKAMPYKTAAALLAPIVCALDYAHNEGIIHRDVKPDAKLAFFTVRTVCLALFEPTAQASMDKV
jgi:serine/threonine-protein kinase